MDSRLVALSLTLDKLNVNLDVSSIDSRKSMQKAVFLAQEVGLNLGYQFNWYVKGPYSSTLADDYYKIDVDLDKPATGDRKLRAEWTVRLDALREALKNPLVGKLSNPDWLELVASWYYLRARREMSIEKAIEFLQTSKPHLAPYAEAAEDARRDIEAVCTS